MGTINVATDLTRMSSVVRFGVFYFMPTLLLLCEKVYQKFKRQSLTALHVCMCVCV